jgi:hypothetical protein
MWDPLYKWYDSSRLIIREVTTTVKEFLQQLEKSGWLPSEKK